MGKRDRAARVTTFSSCDRRSVEILDEIGRDNLETRRTRQLATIMYTLKKHIVHIWLKFLIVQTGYVFL